jgi:hypothetical protein
MLESLICRYSLKFSVEALRFYTNRNFVIVFTEQATESCSVKGNPDRALVLHIYAINLDIILHSLPSPGHTRNLQTTTEEQLIS